MAHDANAPGPSPRIEITLLGEMQVRADGELLHFPTRKSQALLALLGLRAGHAQKRDELAGLLWPEVARPQAQASLRQALLSLRKAFPASLRAAVLTDKVSVSLDAAWTTVDAKLLERVAGRSSLGELEHAAALCRGVLLEGFSCGEPAFDGWLETERARLREIALAVLDRLGARQLASGRPREAVETAQRTLRLSPLCERAVRILLQGYAGSGRRAEAVAHYREFEARLRAALGVEPDAQTRVLARELGVRGDARVLPPPTPPSFLSAPRVALCGRARELEVLERALEEVLAGDPRRLIVLQGESGVGKSRLAEALAQRCGERGALIVRGRCFETERVLPFALFVDLLRSERTLTDDALLHRLPAASRAEIARLVPLSSSGLADAPAAARDARVLFDAIGALLLGRADGAPLFVLLEDLQWADTMSLRLLSFLVRRVNAPGGLCVVATVRAEELASCVFLRTVLHELEREGSVSSFGVDPLPRDDFALLLNAVAGSELRDPRTQERIWRISEGNPWVAIETVRSLRRSGDLIDVAQLALPKRVRALILEPVERLVAPARELLEVAAAIGRPFELELAMDCAEAARLSDGFGDAESALRVIEDLMERRLLQQAGDGFAFTHDRIREAIYAGLSEPRRKLVHARVGRALEGLYEGRLDEVAGAIGYHYARADKADAGVAFLLRFAERSARNYGLEEGLSALEEAQRHCAALPPPSRDVRTVEVALRRAACLVSLQRVAEVPALLGPLQAAVERLRQPTLSAPFHAWLALSHIFHGDQRPAEDHGREALAEAERAGDDQTAGFAHSLLSFAALRAGRFEDGIEHGQTATRLLDPTRCDPEIAAFAWIHLAVNALQMGAWRPALEALEEARALGEDSARLSAHVSSVEALLRLCTGELEVALSAARRAMRVAPDPYSLWFAQLVLVRAAAAESAVRGAPEGMAEAACERAIGVLEASVSAGTVPAMRGYVGLAQTVLSEAYLARREGERARVAALAAHDTLREVGEVTGLGAALRAAGRAELLLGRPESARAYLGRAAAAFAALGARFDRAMTQLSLSEAALANGDPQVATDFLAEAHGAFVALELRRWSELSAGLGVSPGTDLNV